MFPIVQNASLEEDDSLRGKWSALLANAALSDKILPAYAEILRQLTPPQARILDHLKERGEALGGSDRPITFVVEREELMGLFDLSRADYTLLVSDLDRLNLIDPRRLSYEDAWKERDALYERFRLTALSLGFLGAVTPPAVPSEKS